MSPRTHLAYGLRIESDLPLPLPIGAPRALPRLRLRLLPRRAQEPAPVPLQTLVPGGRRGPLASWARTRRGVLLRCRDLADFEATARLARVDCRPVPGADPRSIGSVFADHVLPLLLAGRGEFVLHASAVRAGDGAIAFLGPRGAGKSTIAAFLARRGHAILADDALLLRFTRRGVFVVPGPPAIRLVHGTSKRRFRFSRKKGSGRGIPLHRIFILKMRWRDPLRARDALPEVVNALLLLDRDRPSRIRSDFLRAQAIVRKGLVTELVVPRARRLLHRFHDSLEKENAMFPRSSGADT